MKKIFLLAAAILCSLFLNAKEPIKIGIIGLDTSHSTAFTELLNGSDDPLAQDFQIVAAYPYGSKTIKSSYERIPKYIEEVKKYGVEITSSIAELLDKVDVVMLETNDGRLHFEQALEVFKAGKICYIDKPIAATLGEAIAIYAMSEKYHIPIFSSSALRYAPINVQLRNGDFGPILGADCYSPHTVEPTHPDYGFYGIHGVEQLFTIMGVGCNVVSRASASSADVVTGVWKDGRIGTFRAIKEGPHAYGGSVVTPKGVVQADGYQGYKVLLVQILDFFKTGVPPVSKEETLEIFTFMKASNMSAAKGGRPVKMEDAFKAGMKDANKILKKYR